MCPYISVSISPLDTRVVQILLDTSSNISCDVTAGVRMSVCEKMTFSLSQFSAQMRGGHTDW